jgi:deoxyribodipyrimidine photo-lyase
MTHLVWFRNDLRLTDNPALSDACERAGDTAVIGVYLAAADQAREHGEGDPRLGFVRQTLEVLRDDLAALGIPLVIVAAPRFEDAPAALMAIARERGARSLCFNAEYGYNEVRRDQAVQRACGQQGLDCRAHQGDVILPPGSVLTGSGEPYSVFTPFKRRWQSLVSVGDLTPLPTPSAVGPAITPEPLARAVGALPTLPVDPDWPAGEAEAVQRLGSFVEGALLAYERDRDLPAVAGTSRLSPYLALGAISVRTCYQRAASAAGERAAAWLNELIWREFYRHVMALFPHVGQGRAFRRHLDRLQWRHDPDALDAWRAGMTGYPLVDAGMRELAQTGYMHNRVRMVTAMFLTKHLLIDWREGERHFMSRLRDADFASNNGGWQWSASTGTDAAPYFRIFNPTSQAERFDKDGAYVRRFVPELADGARRYPDPIVDHRTARQRALDFFRGGDDG